MKTKDKPLIDIISDILYESNGNCGGANQVYKACLKEIKLYKSQAKNYKTELEAQVKANNELSEALKFKTGELELLHSEYKLLQETTELDKSAILQYQSEVQFLSERIKAMSENLSLAKIHSDSETRLKESCEKALEDRETRILELQEENKKLKDVPTEIKGN
jgi:chromosome segregation ATPase